MIKYLILFSVCLASNPVNEWIDKHVDILEYNIKSVSFQFSIYSESFNIPEDSVIKSKIIVGNEKQFRFEMGPRTVVSDGLVWKSYDARSNQIFIQDPDKQLEKSLFAWVKYKRIKALPVKLESDGGYRLNLLGKENDVRTYFHSGSGELKSIVIKQNDFQLEISRISLAIEKHLDLNIGNDESITFDLR
jgi:outer membrane lipoprotein-sorting protein